MSKKSIITSVVLSTAMLISDFSSYSVLEATEFHNEKTKHVNELNSLNIVGDAQATSNEETILTTEELINLFNIRVLDELGNILDNTIQVDDSEVDYSRPSTYNIYFTTTDSNDDVMTFTGQLKINDNAPQITLINNVVTIEEGEKITDYIDAYGVEASEITQGDLTDKVKVEASNVNYSTPGMYTVIFSVEDQEGTYVSAVVRLIVEASEVVVPEEPEVILPEEPEVILPEEPEVILPEEPEVILPEEPELILPEEPEVILPEEPNEKEDNISDETIDEDEAQSKLPVIDINNPDVGNSISKLDSSSDQVIDDLNNGLNSSDYLQTINKLQLTGDKKSENKVNTISETKINSKNLTNLEQNRVNNKSVKLLAPSDPNQSEYLKQYGKGEGKFTPSKVSKVQTNLLNDSALVNSATDEHEEYIMKIRERLKMEKEAAPKKVIKKKLEREALKEAPYMHVVRVVLARLGIVCITAGVMLGFFIQYKTW